jgi:deazaflavin-dependent oxidoreductase (nitroreductase family)
MTETAEMSFEDAIVADMRAHGGAVTTGPLAGHPILIMTSRGAKTGEPRRALLTYSRDGDNYVVAGTAGGSPKDPKWVRNLQANPDVDVEINLAKSAATATLILDGPERDRLWAQHVVRLPHFAAYPEQIGRVIPMVRLTLAR